MLHTPQQKQKFSKNKSSEQSKQAKGFRRRSGKTAVLAFLAPPLLLVLLLLRVRTAVCLSRHGLTARIIFYANNRRVKMVASLFYYFLLCVL